VKQVATQETIDMVMCKFFINFFGLSEAKRIKLDKSLDDTFKTQKVLYYDAVFNLFVTDYALMST